jgi:hypothetical protein
LEKVDSRIGEESKEELSKYPTEINKNEHANSTRREFEKLKRYGREGRIHRMFEKPVTSKERARRMTEALAVGMASGELMGASAGALIAGAPSFGLGAPLGAAFGCAGGGIVGGLGAGIVESGRILRDVMREKEKTQKETEEQNKDTGDLGEYQAIKDIDEKISKKTTSMFELLSWPKRK